MKSIHRAQPMSTQTAGYFLVFGVFLILLGVIGFVTHPERGHTALIAGGGFGLLWILWGILSARGVRWSWLGALATTALLALACVWRGSLSWLAVAGGQPEKAFASLLITLMLALALVMLYFLVSDRRSGAEESAADGGH